MTREELSERVKLLPPSPGVYLMKNKDGKIIYVGKSKSLKNRVAHYFQPIEKLEPKTAHLSANIFDFECLYTDSEAEALILENELIKKHKPKYNILLKDSKTYPYIRITNDAFPRLVISRIRNEHNGKYFGPYTSAIAAKDIIKTVQKTFKIASCTKKLAEGVLVGRPCLNYHINQCSGPCSGKITKAEYREIFSEIESFIKGDYNKTIKSMREKMQKASEEMRFEAAAYFRDRAAALEKLSENQKIVFSKDNEQDVFGFFEGETLSAISILFIREGKLIDKELIVLSPDEISDSHTLFDFLQRYYKQREYVPKSVLLSFDLGDELTDQLSVYLSETTGKNIRVYTPERGTKRALSEMAVDNARQSVRQYTESYEKDIRVLIRLSELLNLDAIPERIEAYDISNSGKDSMYAGMIVLENGKLKRSDYRSFSIKSLNGEIDDYGAMREALSRRLHYLAPGEDSEKRQDSSFSALPDLILVDGGKGHVSAVRGEVEKTGLPISVFGMVKDSFHKTRTLTDGENDISIAKEQALFSFIYKIQEEVHRFTFSKMDTSRRKTVKKSSLEDIRGIGKEKAKILLKTFQSLQNIRSKSIDELSAAKGISKRDAEEIYKHFHK